VRAISWSEHHRRRHEVKLRGVEDVVPAAARSAVGKEPVAAVNAAVL
jgi:hypothetical protein